MNIEKRKNNKGDKIYFYIANGRKIGERTSAGVFIYTHPKNQMEKNHNKQALVLIETKKSELQLEHQSIGTGFFPSHKFKANFLDYYAEFVKNNVRKGNRHLQCSLTQFRVFLGKDFIAPVDITEELCKRFRIFAFKVHRRHSSKLFFQLQAGRPLGNYLYIQCDAKIDTTCISDLG